MASEFPDIPHNTRKVYRRFEMWRSAHTGRVPITEQLVGCGGTQLGREHGVFRVEAGGRAERRRRVMISSCAGRGEARG